MNDSDTYIEELAFECLQRMEEEGQAAIDDVCARHPEHAESVRALVNELSTFGLLDPELSKSPDSQPKMVGEFEILRRIGGGGMGVVYLAEQARLGRKVALKLIRPGLLMGTKVQERFRREIEAISRLDHPGICTVYEAGEAEGTPYLAMRYIEGQSLAAVIQHNRQEIADRHVTSGSSTQDLDRRLEVIEKVARALHTAHESGLVHRDIKPANIMLDQAGEPVILDFGLARTDAEGVDSLTASGEQLGTPAYMAPEQITGRPVDRRTDIYALGVTLYEYSTSHPAFDSPTRETLYRSILTEEAPSPRRWNRAIGREHEIVLAKAMAKDSVQRFDTALDLAQELERIRKRIPIRTRRPGPIVRTIRWVQRNPTASGILGATAVGLLMALYFLLQSRLSQTRFRALALLRAAGEVEKENPVLAFKLAREALDADPSTTVVSRIQEIAFGLRHHICLDRQKIRLRKGIFSPNGRIAAVWGGDCPLMLYDGESGRSIARLCVMSRQGFRPFAFTTASDGVAAGDSEGLIRRYAIRESKVHVLPGAWRPPGDNSHGRLKHLTYADDGRLLATYMSGEQWLFARDGSCTPLPRPKPLTFRWHKGSFLPKGRILAAGAIWSRDGSTVWKRLEVDRGWTPVVCVTTDYILTATIRGTQLALRLFDMDGNTVVSRTLQRPWRYELTHAEANKDGSRILLAFQNGSIQVLDRQLRTLAGWHTEESRTMMTARFSPSGDRIVTGSWGGVIQIHDLEGEPLDSLRGHTSGVNWIDYSPDGQRLLTVGIDGHAKIWPQTPSPGVPMHLVRGWVGFDVCRDGEHLVFADESGRLALVDPAGVIEKEIQLSAGYFLVDHLQASEQVVLAQQNRGVFVWNPLSDKAPETMPSLGRLHGVIRQVEDDTWAVHRIRFRDLVLWNTRTRKRQKITKVGQFVSSFDVSSDKHFAVGLRNGEVLVLDSNGRPVREPLRASSTVNTVLFSRDCRWLLAGAADNKVYLWDLETGREILFSGHQNGISAVAFSLDMRRIAAASADGWVRVWDRDAPGEAISKFHAHKSGARNVAFMKGDRIVTAGADGTICWWQMDVEKLREQIRGMHIPALTTQERQPYEHLLGN